MNLPCLTPDSKKWDGEGMSCVYTWILKIKSQVKWFGGVGSCTTFHTTECRKDLYSCLGLWDMRASSVPRRKYLILAKNKKTLAVSLNIHAQHCLMLIYLSSNFTKWMLVRDAMYKAFSIELSTCFLTLWATRPELPSENLVLKYTTKMDGHFEYWQQCLPHLVPYSPRVSKMRLPTHEAANTEATILIEQWCRPWDEATWICLEPWLQLWLLIWLPFGAWPNQRTDQRISSSHRFWTSEQGHFMAIRFLLEFTKHDWMPSIDVDEHEKLQTPCLLRLVRGAGQMCRSTHGTPLSVSDYC